MPTIVFEGKHCSGKRDVGRIVARELGFDFIDRIMLAEIAKKVGSTVEALSLREYKKPTLVDKFARGISQILNNSSTVGIGGDPYFGPGIENIMAKDFHELDETIIKNPEDVDYQRMIEATDEVIRDIADLGKVLVIGRGAGSILKNKENIIRFFFVTNEDDRVKRAMKMHNLSSEEEGAELLKHADHAQKEYFTKAFGVDLEDLSMYHGVLNTSELNPEQCSKVILNLVKENLKI
tara:strand:+ start:1303 stop:2010 length:708 start_codon:yes stop_codon:yes gene_type:complete